MGPISDSYNNKACHTACHLRLILLLPDLTSMIIPYIRMYKSRVKSVLVKDGWGTSVLAV